MMYFEKPILIAGAPEKTDLYRSTSLHSFLPVGETFTGCDAHSGSRDLAHHLGRH
jgi:hypothetical protein